MSEIRRWNAEVGKWQSAECIAHRASVEVRGQKVDDEIRKSEFRQTNKID